LIFQKILTSVFQVGSSKFQRISTQHIRFDLENAFNRQKSIQLTLQDFDKDAPFLLFFVGFIIKDAAK